MLIETGWTKVDNLSLDHQRMLYPDAIRNAGMVLHELPSELSREALTSAKILFAQAWMLRPLIVDPKIKDSPFVKPIEGGDDYNQFEGIDVIGGELAQEILRKSELPGVYARIEEHKKWEQETGGEPQSLWVVDPTDGSRRVGVSAKGIGAGLAVYDTKGNLKAGGMVNLSEDGKQIMIVEQNKAYLFHYNDENGIIKPVPFPQHHDIDSEKPLKLAYLDRRNDAIRNRLKGKIEYEWSKKSDFNTFGPWSIFALMRGEIDAVIDPHPQWGQKWYEAVIWGALAEKFCDVRNLSSPHRDYGEYVVESFGKRNDPDGGVNNKPRIQLLIARNNGINDKLEECFRNKIAIQQKSNLSSQELV